MPSYQFNIETLSYEKIESFSIRSLLERSSFLNVLVTLSFAAIIAFITLIYIKTPGIIQLENQKKQLLVDYQLLTEQINKVSRILAEIQYRDEKMYRSVYEMQPVPNSIRRAGFGGVNKYANLRSMPHSNVIIEANKRLDIVTKQLYVQSLSFDEVLEGIKDREKMISSIPAIQPVASKEITGFCPFGMRLHPILNYVRLHAGVDLCAKAGTEIHASGDGVVTVARLGRGIGQYIKINHGYGYETLYGHVSKMLVKAGQKVKRGDVIALVGTTGLSFVNHLHYEVHKNGKPVDPCNFYLEDLSNEEYERMISICSTKQNAQYD